MKRIGVYAGSFDPPTLGHLDIIERALPLLDVLVIAIGKEASKSPHSSLEERKAMLAELTKPLEAKADCAIEIADFSGLVVDFAKKSNAQFIVRGLRNGTDYDYEAQMAQMNKQMAPEVETIFLTANPATAMISSTLVRQIATMGGDVALFVPPAVLKRLAK